jgi:DNA-binding transcriptional regulator GbsR (MarR family)
VLGEILTFAALTAPEPMSILELLLVTTTSATAVSVVVVVLLIAPLVRSSIFPEVV